MRTSYSDIKFVPLSGYTPDATGFFEAIAIEGHEGKFIRVSAADQKRYFGKVVFGRRAIRVARDGQITLTKTQAYGRDYDSWTFRWDGSQSCFVWHDGSKVTHSPANF